MHFFWSSWRFMPLCLPLALSGVSDLSGKYEICQRFTVAEFLYEEFQRQMLTSGVKYKHHSFYGGLSKETKGI